MARIAKLNPELFDETAAKAESMYREQLVDSSLLLRTVCNLAGATLEAEREGAISVCTKAWVKYEEES